MHKSICSNLFEPNIRIRIDPVSTYRLKITIICLSKNFLKEVKKSHPSYSTNRFLIWANLPQLNSTSTPFDSLSSPSRFPEIPDIYSSRGRNVWYKISEVQRWGKNQRGKSRNNTRQINTRNRREGNPFLNLPPSVIEFFHPLRSICRAIIRKWRNPPARVSKRDQLPSPPFESFIINLMKAPLFIIIIIYAEYRHYSDEIARRWISNRLNWINGNGREEEGVYLSLESRKIGIEDWIPSR